MYGDLPVSIDLKNSAPEPDKPGWYIACACPITYVVFQWIPVPDGEDENEFLNNHVLGIEGLAEGDERIYIKREVKKLD